jgi:CheY-like chemotaxis protein
VDTLEEIDHNVDILIVCSKLFDQQTCKDTLKKFEKLQLIYIEGVEGSFSCEHERFFLLEQPMTGSALFDRLIELMDGAIYDYAQQTGETKSKENRYKGKVLVAEDNETNQMLIAILLEERGVEYTIVENGKEAVATLLKGSYDLTFMDINMPLLDGIEATKILREKGYTKPIVSLSANVIEADTKAFKEAGMDDTLNKPIIPQELDAILQKYLQKEQEESFRVPTIEEIGDMLMLQDDVVKKLLSSLAQTFQESIGEMQQGKTTKALLHKIKGAAGNMRFTQIYNLAAEIEENFESMEIQTRNEKIQNLLMQLQHAVKKIREKI